MQIYTIFIKSSYVTISLNKFMNYEMKTDYDYYKSQFLFDNMNVKHDGLNKIRRFLSRIPIRHFIYNSKVMIKFTDFYKKTIIGFAPVALGSYNCFYYLEKQ